MESWWEGAAEERVDGEGCVWWFGGMRRGEFLVWC